MFNFTVDINNVKINAFIFSSYELFMQFMDNNTFLGFYSPMMNHDIKFDVFF